MDMHLFDDLAEEMKTFVLIGNMWNLVFAVGLLILGIILSNNIRMLFLKILNKFKIDKTISIIISYILYFLSVGTIAILILIKVLHFSRMTIFTLSGVFMISIFLAFKSYLQDLGSSYIIFLVKSFRIIRRETSVIQ